MSDGIFTAETGLRSFEAGLQAISNDTSNLNTPGYKGSTVLFADLVGGDASGMLGGDGEGVTTLGTAVNFSSGQVQADGNPLDLAISGNGFFTLEDSKGNIHYTQDGQFKFDPTGTLVSSATGEKVMALNGSGNLVPITLGTLQTNPAQATKTVTFAGNLLSNATTTADTVGSVTVIDASGNTHTLSVNLAEVSGSTGSWNVTLTENGTQVGSSTSPLVFVSGTPQGNGTVSIQYTPAGGGAVIPLTLDFSKTTSNAAGTSSTLAFASQDGVTVGTLQSETFDSTGTLQLAYSNNQTVPGAQLALANFASPDDVKAISANEFEAKGSQNWQVGVAGSGVFGTIQSGSIEASNVDLSQEFSDLVIMQRGYQACSQVISTASDMLSSLFNMVVK
jgi:flagellar hook protein FlgE